MWLVGIRNLYCDQTCASCAPLKIVSDRAKFLVYCRANVKLNSWADCWRMASWGLPGWGGSRSCCSLNCLLQLSQLLDQSSWELARADSPVWIHVMEIAVSYRKLSQHPRRVFRFSKESQYKTNTLLPSNSCYKKAWFSQQLYTKTSDEEMGKNSKS